MRHITVFIAAIMVLFPFCSPGQIQAEVRYNYKRGSYKGCYYDVVVTQNGTERNITMFRPWEAIQEVLLSPDKRYLMVRHKPQRGKSCLLSIYDLKTFRLIKRMAPGFGGDFSWNDRHQVMHQWGCGTNCANFRIYDLELHELFFTLSSGGFLLSPQNDFLVQYAMDGRSMWVYHLAQIKRGYKPLVYHCDIDSDL